MQRQLWVLYHWTRNIWCCTKKKSNQEETFTAVFGKEVKSTEAPVGKGTRTSCWPARPCGIINTGILMHLQRRH